MIGMLGGSLLIGLLGGCLLVGVLGGSLLVGVLGGSLLAMNVSVESPIKDLGKISLNKNDECTSSGRPSVYVLFKNAFKKG